MNKLQGISSDPYLKEYASGACVRYTPPIQPILAPTVQVGTVNGHYTKHAADSRLKLPRSLRAIGGHAVKLEVQRDGENFQCEVHALDVPLDWNFGDEDLKWLVPDALDLLAEIEGQLIEAETISLAFEVAGAGSGLDFGDEKGPIQLIDEQLLILAKQARSDSLGVVFGAVAWGKFKNHPRVIAGGGLSIAWETHRNLFHTGARFGACYSLVDEAREGLAQAVGFMFPPDAILLVSRSENPTRRSPDFMKTFRVRNGAQGFKVKETNDGRIILVQNDWAVDLKVTNEDGVARFNVV